MLFSTIELILSALASSPWSDTRLDKVLDPVFVDVVIVEEYLALAYIDLRYLLAVYTTQFR